MRRHALPLLLMVPALWAQEPAAAPAETSLSAGERRQALQLLGDARTAVQAAMKLTAAQRAWKPAPDKWSVDECLEHITVTEELLSGMVPKALGGPRNPASRADIKVVDAEVVGGVKDRSRKFNAPEMLVPTHRFKEVGALEAAFNKVHGSIEELVKTSAADWRGRVSPHPAFGALDTYQWVLLAAGHTLRHCAQIEEVKAAPGFPKG